MSEEKCGENKMCQLLSAKELARILSISVRTVWRLRSSGKLPKPIMVGSSVRWRDSDIEDWLDRKVMNNV